MNVSMQDGFNLGWKLASVLRGQCRPELLHSYSEERYGVAKQLIDFDRELSAMMGARPKASPDDDAGVDPVVFQQYFQQHGRFTAGVATQYRPSALTGTDAHQHHATGFVIGTRFHSAPVVRLADAKPLQLGHVVEADGRWRLFVFADARRPDAPDSRLAALCHFLQTDPRSPVVRYTARGADIDSLFDVRAVLQQGHRTLSIRDVPPLLRPEKGRLGLIDHEKVFCPEISGADVFDLRGIDRDEGALVVVRPDQYVAHVLPLDAVDELGCLLRRVHDPHGRRSSCVRACADRHAQSPASRRDATCRCSSVEHDLKRRSVSRARWGVGIAWLDGPLPARRRSSRRPSWLRCTSSGPSARRSRRAVA